MKITTTVSFDEDLGQNPGTLFEARDSDGRVVFGAGFAGLYNTFFRMDRWTLQFFVRGGDNSCTFEKLPPPSDDGGNYMFDFDGRVYQYSPYQDCTARWWDDAAGSWQVDESFGIGETMRGEGKMRVAGRILQFKNGEVLYDGEIILSAAADGFFHNFYYAHGCLSFYQNNSDGDPPWSKLHAVTWKPGQRAIDIGSATTLDLRYPGEKSFAIGQLGSEVIHSSNLGGVYVLDGLEWRVLRQSSKGVSHQLYSMLNWYDRMLVGHYPTGNLFEYAGDVLRQLENWPPVMPGVSTEIREAQTTCLYGGDLYVGVWPWAELSRYDAFEDRWHFVQCMFEHPEKTDQVDHPWEDVIKAYNETQDDDVIYNDWGHRITGLCAMGDSLYISVSPMGCYLRDLRLEFLHDDDIWNEYRTIYRMRKSGCAAGSVAWTDGPTQLEFTAEGDRIEVAQDGIVIAAAAVDRDAVKKMETAAIEWGNGMFGPLSGEIRG